MKAICKLLLVAFFMPAFSQAQDEEAPKRSRVELTYINVKVGHEKDFVEGVKSTMPNNIKAIRLMMLGSIMFVLVRTPDSICGSWADLLRQT